LQDKGQKAVSGRTQYTWECSIKLLLYPNTKIFFFVLWNVFLILQKSNAYLLGAAVFLSLSQALKYCSQPLAIRKWLLPGMHYIIMNY